MIWEKTIGVRSFKSFSPTNLSVRASYPTKKLANLLLKNWHKFKNKSCKLLCVQDGNITFVTFRHPFELGYQGCFVCPSEWDQAWRSKRLFFLYLERGQKRLYLYTNYHTLVLENKHQRNHSFHFERPFFSNLISFYSLHVFIPNPPIDLYFALFTLLRNHSRLLPKQPWEQLFLLIIPPLICNWKMATWCVQ